MLMSAAWLQPMPANRPVSTHWALTHASATLATDWMEMDRLVQVCIVLCGGITIPSIHSIIISLMNQFVNAALIFLISEIHECNDGSHSCEHNCENTAGGFVCSCFTGYTLSSNGFSCLSMCEWTNLRLWAYSVLLHCIADMRIPDS